MARGRPFTATTLAWLAPHDVDGESTTMSPTLTPLRHATRVVLEQHYRQTSRYRQSRTAFAELCHLFPDAHLETLTTVMLREWIARMRLKGNRSSTINCKLSVVGVLFSHFEIEGRKVPYVAKGHELKWWLTPELEDAAVTWLRTNCCDDLADYVRWTVLTGLRVEESLRVQRQHLTGFSIHQPSLTVPGTKSRAAQSTIPLFHEAANIAMRRLGLEGAPTDHLFDVPYVILQREWQRCRNAIGLEGTHGATLKAFRRSFARHATERGLPPDMLRQYLRHEHLSTTAGYLKLVGGYSTEHLRQWFT